MTHGAPDWNKYRIASTTFPVQDLAELAVRLGSIVRFDRRGDVIFLEHFEHGLNHWRTSIDEDGASITISPTTARTGGYSAKLVTGDSIGDTTQIMRTMPYPQLSRFGLEVSFTAVSDLTRIAIGFSLYDGTTQYQAHIWYRPDSADLQYYDQAGSMLTFATGITLYEHIKHFHTMKLVCDFTTGYYTRLILNETSHDISAYAFPSNANATLPRITAIIELRNNTAANRTIYVDDVIVTQDEP